jgi:2-oxoisovalerate dehydrogenase E2 component (dihydrolipoyl transacylase)
MSMHLIKMPDVGEGVAEAEVAEWHVSVGDHVSEDQILAAVMTDKATVEIPSPVAGRIVECAAEIGSILAVGSKLVVIEVEGERAAPEPASETIERPEPQAIRTQAVPASVKVDAVDDVGKPKASAGDFTSEKPVASPAVRRRALDIGLDLRTIRGSGPAGRISHADLDAAIVNPQVSGRPATAAVRPATQEIKLTGLRRKIAERMAEATRRIAHFSYIEEIDVTALEELRAHLNVRYSGQRPKLTVLPFIIRALVAATAEFPQMNAHFDDDKELVTRHSPVHVGIATQTASGLMVPVIRNAEDRDLWNLSAEIRRLADAARGGHANREELSGSTITISSLGDLGGIATTPVINRPEVAIVGVNRIAIRPVWDNDRFVPRRMMNLSSSFDHRVIDGQDAALFIRRVKELIELPALMFMEA